MAGPAFIDVGDAGNGFDASARWAEGLRRGGHEREEALFRLRAHLAGAALFALRRRRFTGDGVQDREAARMVRDAAEAALTAVLADLSRYRGQSAFATWTAKYAIREATVVTESQGSKVNAYKKRLNKRILA